MQSLAWRHSLLSPGAGAWLTGLSTTHCSLGTVKSTEIFRTVGQHCFYDDDNDDEYENDDDYDYDYYYYYYYYYYYIASDV